MKDKAKKSIARYLPMYGCFSTGIIYSAIGVIAILSFFKLKNGGADEVSLLVFLNNFTIGKIIVWIILSGTISYIIWRIFESITDPYEYGSKTKGIITRTGIAMSSIPDALIAYSAILILLGKSNVKANGQPEEKRQMIDHILQLKWGESLIIALGFIIIATALIQLVYGTTNGYKERAYLNLFNPGLKKTVQVLAWIGYISRGIILGIIGFFFIKAGSLDKAQFIVNTDKAFDFIGDEVGHLYFILTALGTICYGFFMFALSITYDAD